MAVLPDLEMQVRAGGASTGTDEGDGLAPLDPVPFLDQDALCVGVAAMLAPAMVDLDHVTVAIPVTGMHDHAGTEGTDRRTQAIGDVDTLMVGLPAHRSAAR